MSRIRALGSIAANSTTRRAKCVKGLGPTRSYVGAAREWRTLSEGESLSIPRDTVHTLRNRSSAVVRFRDTHEPALDFQDYIEALDRQAAAGKITTRMTPSTLIHGAMVLREHRTTQLSASPAQRAAETALSLVGRALGHRTG
jgi:hypothetical protein